MGKNYFRILSLALPVAASMALLSSCINDAGLADNSSTSESLTAKTLTVSVNTGTTSNTAKTRTTNITSDPSDQATINRITIGVFSSDGSTKKAVEEFTSPNTSGSTYSVSTTTPFTATDQVLVAVNAPAGTFSSVTTATGFKNETVAIATALTGSSSGTAEASSSLPMFGSAASLTSDGSNYTATVGVHYMVSKIILSSLAVNFSSTGGYPSATFTPTEVFLTNVPDELDFYPYDSYTYASASAYYCGNSDVASGISNTYAGYLGTGTLDNSSTTPTTSALSGTTSPDNTWGGSSATSLYFYTMPNSSTNTSYPTRLVIKGTFDSDGAGNTSTVYYPVEISGGIQPGYEYSLTVTIKTIGSASAAETFDSKSVDVTVNVNDFTTATQETTFE